MRHISSKSLNQWIIVFPGRDEQICLRLVDALIQVCQPFGKIRSFCSWFIITVFVLFIFNRNAY